MSSIEIRFIIEQSYPSTDWKTYPYYPRGLSELIHAQEAIELAEKNDNDFLAFPKRQFQIVKETSIITREVVE